MAVDTAEPPAAQTSSKQTVAQNSRFQRYRVRTGMFAWMMHRLTGVGLVVYLIVHVWGLKSLSDPAAFNALIAKYHAPIYKIGEFGLLVAVVYHAINGLRIVLIDFLGWSPKQKKLFWTLGAVALVLIVVGGYPSIYALAQWMGA
jgi:succinate dehydrogenase / fumarate reductase cytochrome b subunit